MSRHVSNSRRRVTRTMQGQVIEYRGSKRAVIVEVDPVAGTVSTRLEGCRKRRVYAAKDLQHWGAQLQLV